jgi:hypothetical protein
LTIRSIPYFHHCGAEVQKQAYAIVAAPDVCVHLTPMRREDDIDGFDLD